MNTVSWRMTVDTALEFFKRCTERGAQTEEERIKILVELAKEGMMESVVVTNRTKEEYLQDQAKRFNILKVGNKND